MDIATLLGLAGAFGLIIWSMLQGGTLAAYTNIPGLGDCSWRFDNGCPSEIFASGVYKRGQGRRQGVQ